MKFTIAWFLIGIILGINSLMIGFGWEFLYYLSFGFLMDKVIPYCGDVCEWIGYPAVLLVPIIFYTLIGYTVGHLLRQK